MVMLCSFAAAAQGAFRWLETEHDFGTFSEEQKRVSCKFRAVNEGDTTAVITNVITTCGCTKADYPKHPIKPNETGVISVTFNPRDYTGEFLKVITVRTPNQRIKLKISGVVIPKNVQ